MYIETQNSNPKRIAKFPQRTFQGIPTGKPPRGNKKIEGVKPKNRLFFKLTAQPLLSQPISYDLTEQEFRQLAKLMVDATRAFTGSIDGWEFGENNSLQELILRCAYRLQERARVDHIDVFHIEEGTLKLGLKRFIGSRATIYCISLKPIFKLKMKNRLLYNVLISFVKCLPFDSIFDKDGKVIDWIWSYLLRELDYCKEDEPNEDYQKRLEGSVNFYVRYSSVYNQSKVIDWQSQLKKYHPKKKVYKDIKELLLSSIKIDFSSPFKIAVRDNYECEMEHYQTFLLVDDEDSDFTSTYIDMLNQSSNDYDILSAYSYAFIEEGKIENFDENIIKELKKIEDFIFNLNELLQKS